MAGVEHVEHDLRRVFQQGIDAVVRCAQAAQRSERGLQPACHMRASLGSSARPSGMRLPGSPAIPPIIHLGTRSRTVPVRVGGALRARAAAAPPVRPAPPAAPRAPRSALFGRLARGTIARVKPSLTASRSRSWPRGAGRTSPARPISPNTTTSRGSWSVGERGHHRERHRKVGRRLADAHAADGVDEHVLVDRRQPRVPVQHREQHRQAVLLEPDRQAARAGRLRRIDQRLDLDQQRPRALERREHAGACDVGAVVREKQRRRIAHCAQPALGHGEHAEFVHRAEAVLDRAHQAKARMRVALEVQHGVDDVLEHARPGDRAFLGDVTDQQHRSASCAWRGASAAPRIRAPARPSPAPTAAPRSTGSGSSRSPRPAAWPSRAPRGCARAGSRPAAARRRRPARAGARAARPVRPIPRPLRRASAGATSPSAASACSSSVDLPMPGSPPSSTTCPATRPPPSTRSSSSMPTGMRASSRAVDPARAAAARSPAPAPRRRCVPGFSARVSTSVPAAPHDGQAPNHCSALAPQSEQT